MKIAFFGTPRFAQIVLEKLIDSPFKPSIVITAPDAKSGRGQKLVPTPAKQTAEKYGIKVLEPKTLNSQLSPPKEDPPLEETFNSQFDLAILVAYGKIIPKEILAIPKYGFINVHPSLLPKYRGPSPVQSAILNGEKKTGVTIMLLDEEIDHGPILAQKETKIELNDNNKTLHEKLGEIGAGLLIEILPHYLAHLRGVQSRSKAHLGGETRGTSIFIPPKPQIHSKATFTKHIEKQDGYIDPENPTDKKTIDRMIRAFYSWPTAWTKVDGKIIKFLPNGKIQPAGKRTMSLAEFKNGYPEVFKQISHLFDNKAQS